MRAGRPPRQTAPIPHGRRRWPQRRAIIAVAILALVATACGGGATPPPAIPSGAIVVHAHNLTFDTKELQIPAGTSFSLAFVNEDGDTHNIAIRTKSGSDGDLLFRFDPVSSTTVVLTVGPIPKGNYFFLCEVHPQMWGTVFAY